MGKSGRFLNKILARYLLSYLAVLIMPLLVFSLLHERYFLLLYRDEIFRQNMLMLDNVAIQMDMRIEEMDAMLVQLANNELLQGESLRASAPRYAGMKVLLRGLLASRPSYARGMFYTAQTPDVIYTADGTYNPAYYWKLRKGGEFVTLPEYVEDLEQAAWLFPGDLSGKTVGLTRIMRLPAYEDGYLLLTIDERSLSALTERPQGETYLFDRYGTQLYPFERMPPALLGELETGQDTQSYRELSEGRFALYSTPRDGGVRCIRVLSADDVLHSVRSLQKLYRTVLLLLLTLGGALIYVLAFLTHRPIRELDEMVSSRVQEIPKNLHGVQKASYLIETMEQRMDSLQKRNALERLFLRLLFDRLDDEKDLEKECELAGLDCYADEYQVVLLQLGAKPDERYSLPAILDQVLGEGFSWQMMEYPDELSLLLLLGYGRASGYIVGDKLSVIADRLNEEAGLTARIAAGGSCESLRDISRSYREAAAAGKLSAQSAGGPVASRTLPPDRQTPFIYPKLELDALYTALINIDIERARFMVEVLSDLARSAQLSNFTRASLCFDMMKCYARAYEDLNEEPQTREAYRLESIYCGGEPEPEALIRTLGDLHSQFAADMQKHGRASVREERPEDTVARVLEYINSHWRDGELCVSSVAEEFSLSLSNLSHRFKMQTGKNISAYISEKKMMYAKELLSTTTLTLSEISERVGYKQTTSFIRKFKQLVNMTPSEFRELCAGRRQDGEET